MKDTKKLLEALRDVLKTHKRNFGVTTLTNDDLLWLVFDLLEYYNWEEDE